MVSTNVRKDAVSKWERDERRSDGSLLNLVLLSCSPRRVHISFESATPSRISPKGGASPKIMPDIVT
jgi:hypothetical protein